MSDIVKKLNKLVEKSRTLQFRKKKTLLIQSKIKEMEKLSDQFKEFTIKQDQEFYYMLGLSQINDYYEQSYKKWIVLPINEYKHARNFTEILITFDEIVNSYNQSDLDLNNSGDEIEKILKGLEEFEDWYYVEFERDIKVKDTNQKYKIYQGYFEYKKEFIEILEKTEMRLKEMQNDITNKIDRINSLLIEDPEFLEARYDCNESGDLISEHNKLNSYIKSLYSQSEQIIDRLGGPIPDIEINRKINNDIENLIEILDTLMKQIREGINNSKREDILVKLKETIRIVQDMLEENSLDYD